MPWAIVFFSSLVWPWGPSFAKISEFSYKAGLHICKAVEAPYCMFVFLRWLIPSTGLSLLVLLEIVLGPHCAVSLVISVAVAKILQQKRTWEKNFVFQF